MPRRSTALLLACLASLLSLSCLDDDDTKLQVDPPHGSLFGHDTLSLTLVDDPGTIRRVTVGGVPAYDLRDEQPRGPRTVTLRPQGAPSPGPAEVVVEGSLATLRGRYRFDAPAAGVGPVWVAFGASFTMGVQSGGLDARSQTHGVAAQTARAAGVYLGLPLFRGDFLAPTQASGLGPDCKPRESQNDLISRLLTSLTDPATGEVTFLKTRVDPDLAPRNVAVGGARVREVVHAASGQVGILEHMVEQPSADLGAALKALDLSQLDRIERLDPDVGLTSDLIGNDVLIAATSDDDLHPEQMTPLASVQQSLAELFPRLGKLRGHYFIGNVPSLGLLPNVSALRARRVAEGKDTEASFDQKLATLDAQIDAYNQALTSAMAPYKNLHLVDFKTEGERLRAGVVIGGERLNTAAFGGFLSLDHLHLSDTGYALYANLFVRTINAALHASIPEVDVEAVHRQDPMGPSALRAAGVLCVPPP